VKPEEERIVKKRFIARRLGILLLQVWGVVTVVFILIQLLPGDPRYLLAGGLAPPETLEALNRDLGLDKPIYVRYYKYMANILTGDLGKSWFTSTPVLEELVRRFPATFELVTFAFVVSILVAIPLGVISAISQKGVLSRIIFLYGMVAGALPEFWWALMLILVFFVVLGIAPPPLGRVSVMVGAPDRITGLYTLDGLVTGNFPAFKSALNQLLMPGLTLAFVFAGAILKMTRTQMMEAIESDFVRYARACGLPPRRIYAYALRNALLPVVTLTGLTYGYLISGAVLIETVFAWGGLGQFAIQSIISSDYFAVTGTVMAVAIFALSVYVLMDIIYALIDPRIKY
jgi:ABC-type dipeptide/oligopeptide/nickel transport system permease component